MLLLVVVVMVQNLRRLLSFVNRASTTQVDPSITKPYARLSLELKQQFDSWKIITEADPFTIAEMFGNIGGFWGE